MQGGEHALNKGVRSLYELRRAVQRTLCGVRSVLQSGERWYLILMSLLTSLFLIRVNLVLYLILKFCCMLISVLLAA